MLEKVKNENPEAKQEDLLTLLHQEWIKSESSIVSLTDIRNTVFAKKSENGASNEVVKVKEEVVEDEPSHSVRYSLIFFRYPCW